MNSFRARLALIVAASLPLPAVGEAGPEGPLLRFQGPRQVVVPPGGVKTLELLATLTVPPPAEAGGVRGWSITVEAFEGTLIAIDLEGLQVSTIFDHDGDPGTPPQPTLLDLADAGSTTAEVIGGPSPRVTSAVALHLSKEMVLAAGTHTIARITVEVPRPADGSCGGLLVGFARSPGAEEQDSSFLLTPAGQVFPPSYAYFADVRPEELRFILSMVPAGAAPPPDGDFVLEETVPAGDFLLETEVLLTSSHPLSGVEGAQGWALSVAHHEPCMTIESFTLEGIRVSTIFDHDGIAETPPVDPHPFDLKESQFKRLEKGDGRFSVLPPGTRGLISIIVLHLTRKMTLHMNVTDSLLRVVYRIHVPSGGTTECRVDFTDGLTGSGSPIQNGVTWMGAQLNHGGPSYDCPELEIRGLVIRLTGQEEIPFVRGDANSDGALDISDASFLLDNLFLGGPRPSCRKTGDLDDNGALEITDPIYLLNFLFLGGPSPRDVGHCRGDPTPDDLGCLSYRCEN